MYIFNLSRDDQCIVLLLLGPTQHEIRTDAKDDLQSDHECHIDPKVFQDAEYAEAGNHVVARVGASVARAHANGNIVAAGNVSSFIFIDTEIGMKAARYGCCEYRLEIAKEDALA
jgi:hypothetical protein